MGWNPAAYFGPSRAFYRSPTWRELRRACKERDGFTCRGCGFAAQTPKERRSLDAHHRVSRPQVEHATGLDVLANLVTLCVTCHESAHGRRIRPTQMGSSPGTPPRMFRVSGARVRRP